MHSDTYDATRIELLNDEIALVTGGMMNLYEPGENPKEGQAGQTKSVIAYRYFGDVGL